MHCKPLNIICWVSKKPIFGFADIKLVLLMNEGVWFDVVLSFQCRKHWECSACEKLTQIQLSLQSRCSNLPVVIIHT